MTYGEMKDFVLQLLNQYSVAGEQVALSYNNQADDVARIPALTRDGLYYVTTAARKLRAAAELSCPEEKGGMLVYDLPDDLYQLISGGLRRQEADGALTVCRDYRLVGGRQIYVPKEPGGVYTVEYYRYPYVPEGTPEEDDFLDCPPEAQSAVAYYVASHLVMEDNSFLYGALYAEFERKMARLAEGITLEWGVTEDQYA